MQVDPARLAPMRRTLAIACIMLLSLPATATANVFDVKSHVGHTPPAPATIATQAVHDALALRGAPYVYGGSTPAGFDCSGFTSYVYGRLGIALAHSSYDQWNAGQHIPRRDLQPGDLVFFAGLGHVGIYIGDGAFVHAPHTGTVVSVDRLSGSWYGAEYDGAVRPYGSQTLLSGAATMGRSHSHSTHRRRSGRVSRAVSKLSSSGGW
jgi:cell wall-associated NlpC family hydrolase